MTDFTVSNSNPPSWTQNTNIQPAIQQTGVETKIGATNGMPPTRLEKFQNCMRAALQNLKNNLAFYAVGSAAVALGSIFGGPLGAVAAFLLTALAKPAFDYAMTHYFNQPSAQPSYATA